MQLRVRLWCFRAKDKSLHSRRTLLDVATMKIIPPALHRASMSWLENSNDSCQKWPDNSCMRERGLLPWQWQRRETCSRGPSWYKDPGGTRSSEGGAAKRVWTEQPSPAGSRHKAVGQRRTPIIKLVQNQPTKIKVTVNRHLLVWKETVK